MIGLIMVAATMLDGGAVPPPPPPVAVVTVAKATPGHYTCTGTDNANADCHPDTPAPVHIDPNPGSDNPAATVAASDKPYSDQLKSDLCDAKPVFCDWSSR